MIPALLVGLGGAALLASVVGRRRRPSLVDMLSPPRVEPDGEPTDLPAEAIGALRGSLKHLDDRYQSLIQTRIDPLLISQLRDEQMRDLAPTDRREMIAQEKEMNRRLVLGVGGLMLLGLRSLTRWPLTPGVIVIGLYSAWPFVKEGWRIAVQERRLSMMHLLLIYLLSLWLGGNFLIGMVGILLSSLGQKVELLTQTTTRHSLTHLLGEQPSRVWVVREGEES